MNLIVESILVWLLVNFDFCLFILAIIAIMINRRINPKLPAHNVVYRWIALFCLVFSNIYAFVMHIWFTRFAIVILGYTASPYHGEVAVLDLVFALFALPSFWTGYAYRMAIAFVSAVLLWLDAGAHLYQIVAWHHYEAASPVTGIFVNIMVPLILLLSARKLKLK